jgi:hypothetical protein
MSEHLDIGSIDETATFYQIKQNSGRAPLAERGLGRFGSETG